MGGRVYIDIILTLGERRCVQRRQFYKFNSLCRSSIQSSRHELVARRCRRRHPVVLPVSLSIVVYDTTTAQHHHHQPECTQKTTAKLIDVSLMRPKDRQHKFYAHFFGLARRALTCADERRRQKMCGDDGNEHDEGARTHDAALALVRMLR